MPIGNSGPSEGMFLPPQRVQCHERQLTNSGGIISRGSVVCVSMLLSQRFFLSVYFKRFFLRDLIGSSCLLYFLAVVGFGLFLSSAVALGWDECEDKGEHREASTRRSVPACAQCSLCGWATD